jgi:hypothetical protein
MAVVVVTRLKGDPQATQPARDAAGILKRHGAVSVRRGVCHAGAHPGQIYAVVTFADWTAYGRAMEGLMADPAWQKFMADSAKQFEVQDRTVLAVEDL